MSILITLACLTWVGGMAWVGVEEYLDWRRFEERKRKMEEDGDE